VFEVVIPSVGIAMEEATLISWFRSPGDAVAEGDVVAEIETDKATLELVSEAAGVLGPQLVAAGEQIPVGAVAVRVYAPGEAIERLEPAPSTPTQAVESSPSSAAGAGPAGGDSADDVHAVRRSPRARRLAAEAERSAAANGQTGDGGRHRAIVAAKTIEAWREIPHFSLTSQLDAGPLLAGLASARQVYGPSITLTDLLLLALARALPEGADSTIALAVATPSGVANPILGNVLETPLPQLAERRAAVVERARAGTLAPGDIGPATTTLSNLRSPAVEQFTGVITPGQTTLLTIGSIAPRPFIDDQRQLVVRDTLYATLMVDHRSFDGADGAVLLERFASALAAADTTDVREGAR
jgi:pyruvate dehydrogenase E2 component (dihydrolipoamide acetyltransferase)